MDHMVGGLLQDVACVKVVWNSDGGKTSREKELGKGYGTTQQLARKLGIICFFSGCQTSRGKQHMLAKGMVVPM